MRIAVYGASGLTGGLVARRLVELGADVVLAGRDAIKLEGVAAELGPRTTVAAAPAHDVVALQDAFRGASVVVACAGPFTRIGEPVLAAAIAGGAHYLDVSGEQGFLRAMYEQHEAGARHAHVCAVPGMGLECAAGDLAAHEAALNLGAVDDDDDPLDEVNISYLFDRFSPSAGTQRSAVATAAAGGVVWRNQRWDPIAPGAERRRVTTGAETREAVSFPAGEVITVPRHVAARRVQTFRAFGRNPWVSRAVSWLAPALPLVARALPDRWVSDAALELRERTDATFTIVATARRGFDEATVTIAGRDVYATSAAIAAWGAVVLARRASGPTGVLAPAEAFEPRLSLDALVEAADLDVTTSFGAW